MARPRGSSPVRSATAARPAAHEPLVPCAFCQGRGRDPFGLLTSLSSCPVCLGKGVVEVPEPRVRCAYCAGRGVQPHARLTCSSCGGKGYQTIPEPRVTCRHCGGRGQAPDSELHLSCPACHGAGMVHVRDG